VLRDHTHRPTHCILLTGLGIEPATQQRDRFGSKCSIARHQCRAAEAAMERNRSIRAQKCGAVGGPGPIELGNKAFAEPVRNRHRVQIALPLGCCPQKPAPLGRAQPFVTVADIPIGADRVEIDRCRCGGMGSVDQYSYPCRMAQGDDLGYRQNQPQNDIDIITNSVYKNTESTDYFNGRCCWIRHGAARGAVWGTSHADTPPAAALRDVVRLLADIERDAGIATAARAESFLDLREPRPSPDQ
jgi:hypothetical protein